MEEKKKIMIVDDVPDIVDMVKHMLQSKGYETMEATSGKECLEKIRENRPDLILLDLMMKPMDGWQTLDAIKRDEKLKSIPVSVLSVVLLTPEIMEGKPIDDIEGYILKPFSKKDLIAEIDEIFKCQDTINNVVDRLLQKVGRKEAEEYERLAKACNRHKKLIKVLEESTKNELVESDSIENVKRSQKRMIEIAERRMTEIERKIETVVMEQL